MGGKQMNASQAGKPYISALNVTDVIMLLAGYEYGVRSKGPPRVDISKLVDISDSFTARPLIVAHILISGPTRPTQPTRPS